MATLVQSNSAIGTSSTAPAVSLGSNTTTGNALIFKVCWLSAGGTLTAPSGFTVDASNLTASSPQVAICSKLNAASVTSGTNFTASLSGSATRWIATIEEWSGIATSSAVDKTATHNTATAASGDTGTTAQTTFINEVAMGAIAADTTGGGVGASTDWSSPTNSFTLLNQNNSNVALGMASVYKIVSAVGTQGTTLSNSQSPNYYGVIATYKSNATGYTFTTTGAGDWATGSTWVGGTAPTSTTIKGAFVKIAHAVTIDPTTTSAIGASGTGNGVARIDIMGTSASLSLSNTNAALTITFNSTGSNAVGTTQGPTAVAASSNDPGADATCGGIYVGKGTLNLVGSSTNPVTLTSQDDSSPIYIRGNGWGGVQGGFGVAVNLTLKYCTMRHLGYNDSTNITFYGITYDGRGGGTIDIENCKFVDPYDCFRVTNGGGSFAGVTISNNWISGTVRGVNGFKLASGTPTSGANTISGNTWDGISSPGAYACITQAGPSAVSNDNTAYTSNSQNISLIDSRNATNGSFARNAFFSDNASTSTVTYVYNNNSSGATGHTITNSFGAYVASVVSAHGGTTCSNLYGRQTNAQGAAQGVIAIGYGGTHSFKNCVGVFHPVTSGFNGMGLMPYTSAGTINTGAAFTVDHCTFYCDNASLPGGTIGVLIGDGANFPAQATRVRSCLSMNLGAPYSDQITATGSFGHTGTITTDGSGNATPSGGTPSASDIGQWVRITSTAGGWTSGARYKITGATGGKWQLTPLGSSPAVPTSATAANYDFWLQNQYTIDTPPTAGVHHNAEYNCTNAGGVGLNSGGGYGSPGFTDGATQHPSNGTYGDLNGSNPNFVAPTRTELTWSTSLSGAGTYSDLMGNFANRSGMTGTSFNSSYTVDALITYVFAGFAPTNSALSGGAYDAGSPSTPAGGWYGAVAGVTSTTGLNRVFSGFGFARHDM